MELFLMISQILLLVCLLVMGVYYVTLLSKIRDVIAHIEDNVKEMSVRAIPVLENLEAITSKLRTITENINDQVSIVKESAQAIKGITDNIVSFERKVQEQIEGPVLEVAGVIGSIVRVIGGVIRRLRGDE